MIATGTLMEDLADRGEMAAEAPYDCIIEIDQDEHKAIIVWRESLAFHAEYNAKTWPEYTESGWLKTGVEDQLSDRLRELILSQGGATVDVYVSESGADEPEITFEVVTDYRDGETYEAWLDRIGWPAVATLINVTDPGTFNSAYLFDMGSLA